MNVENYRQINESFVKALVFHLGSRAGFFSEYNTMIQAIAYCLREGIRFELYSGDANFRVREGWRDFFLPFCREHSNPLHSVFNYRFPRGGIKFKLRKYVGGPLLRKAGKCDYLTYDLWEAFRSTAGDVPLSIPALGWEGSFRGLCRELVGMTWRFRPEIAEETGRLTGQARLPAKYVGVHIRGGDKVKEYEGAAPAAYIEKLAGLSDTRDVLVMTDDYRIFEGLREQYPGWRFYTLEEPSQRGYRHRAHKRERAGRRRDNYIRLFAGVELMSRAEHFVGTYSSNIGGYLGMRMPPDRCHAVDFDEWKIL